MKTDAEKLAEIAKLAADMGTIQDEYAVGLAADVLAVIDGTVPVEQIEAHCNNRQQPDGSLMLRRDTVGEALTAAKEG